MERITETYIVHTKYGPNVIVKTEKGDWYQQQHCTLCHDGGGIFVWHPLEKNDDETPIPVNIN